MGTTSSLFDDVGATKANQFNENEPLEFAVQYVRTFPAIKQIPELIKYFDQKIFNLSALPRDDDERVIFDSTVRLSARRGYRVILASGGDLQDKMQEFTSYTYLDYQNWIFRSRDGPLLPGPNYSSPGFKLERRKRELQHEYDEIEAEMLPYNRDQCYPEDFILRANKLFQKEQDLEIDILHHNEAKEVLGEDGRVYCTCRSCGHLEITNSPSFKIKRVLTKRVDGFDDGNN